MPDGKTHSTATVLLAAGLGVAAYFNGYPWLPLAGGALAGLVLTPDLDLEGGSISNHHMKRAGGCLLAAVWRIFWLPYAMLFRHRSGFTHLPILSTAIRLAYLCIIPAVAYYAFHLPLPALPWWWKFAVIGLALADGVHFILDKLFRN